MPDDHKESEKEMMDRLFNEAAGRNNDRANKRSCELFEAIDAAISREIDRAGPIDSSAHWAAIATLIAKTVMVQEHQIGRTGMFDDMVKGVSHAARKVYEGGYKLEGE
jgi:hypothetical protein